MKQGDPLRESDPGVEAWELLLRTHAALVPRINGEMEAATGLALSWYDVLLELSRAPEGELRMTDLGERVVLSRSHVSRVVDQLASAGLVEKISDPTDRRSTRAALTERGRKVFRRAAPKYLAAIRDHFSSHMSTTQAATIVTGLRHVVNRPD